MIWFGIASLCYLVLIGWMMHKHDPWWVLALILWDWQALLK